MQKSENGSPAIEVDGLKKTYTDGLIRRRTVEALRGVTFRVEKGTIFGLLGPNGAGKTTLIKVLLGIVRKSGGSATLMGLPAGNRLSRVKVGYLPENHRIPRHHTANSALEYYGALSGMPVREIRKRRSELLELVGIGKWGPASIKTFSKGMLQRLGLAQALMHDPDLLVLDEPTDGVDPVGRSEMRDTLRRLKDEGKTVFINSHLLQEIELVCDRVAILVKGELRREGLVETITRRQEAEFEISLQGSEQTIREALRDWRIAEWSASPGGQYTAVLKLGDQPTLNKCVDRLRSAGISIMEIVRRRDTLEEAFLDIVRQPESPFLE